MDAEKGTPCACGEQSFERVVIDRPGREPYRTDFIACVFCKAMFLSPLIDTAAVSDARFAAAMVDQRRYTKSGKRQK